MMKIAIGVMSCIVAIGSLSASAADLPVVPVPSDEVPTLVPGIVFSWTGFYFGGNVGYGWLRNDPAVSGGGISGSATQTLNGASGGGQVGFNWQINHLVVGIESDFEASAQKANTAYAGIAETDRSRWFGTTRARIGYANDRLFFYGTAGAGYSEDMRTLSGALNAALSRAAVGWTAGVGVEGAISVNWSTKLEYLFLDLGNINNTVGKSTINSNFTNNIIRFGVNYKFGGL
jgi:outer membrane immunogenic protein